MNIDSSSLLDNRYEVGEVIGRGATAEVHAGFDRLLRRPVAIKCFEHRLRTSDVDDGRRRFETEARLAASLTHPNIVAVYDLGLEDDHPFLVMECLPGNTLADEILEGPMSAARLRDVMRGVLGGLGSAHAGGVLHRDIKPRNVLIAADGQVKLADFGIATSGDTENLTETGLVVGTPAYLAPERLTGSPATVRADLYSVGVMAYEALTGVQPFQGETPVAVAYAVCHGPLVPVRTRRPDVAAALDHVVSTAMARDPEQRFASASDLLDAFEAALDRPLPADPDETLQVAVLPVHKTQVLPVTAPPEPASARPPQPQPRTKSTAKTKSRSKRRRGSIVLVLATIATLVAVGALALHDRSGSASPSSPTVSTPAVVDTKPLPPALRDPFAQLAQSVQP